MVLEQPGPSSRPQGERRVYAGDPNSKISPPGALKLTQDLTPINWVSVLGVDSQSDERSENYQSQDQLSFVQAISVADAGLIVWCGTWLTSVRLAVLQLCIWIGSALARRGSLEAGCGSLGIRRPSSARYLAAASQHPAVELVDHACDVCASFVVGRNAMVLVHRGRPGVVGSEREGDVVVIAPE